MVGGPKKCVQGVLNGRNLIKIPFKVGYFLYFTIGKNKMQENCARDKVGKAKQMKSGQSKHIEMLNVIIFPCLLYNGELAWIFLL